MKNTSFNRPKNSNQAYFALSSEASSNVSDYDEGYGFDGGSYSTTADLSSFLKKVFIDKTILSAQSLADMQRWTAMDKFKISFHNAQIENYGMGLMK